MDDRDLAERERRSQLAGYRAIAAGARGSRAVDVAPGLFASVVPATPQASIPNSVLYADPELVVRHHARLAALYAAAGVLAWTVWVRPGDAELEAALLERGHAFDGSPALMAAPYAELDLEPRGALDLDPAPEWAVMGEINDRAFGRPIGALGAALGAAPGWQPLLARSEGAPACCVAWLVSADGDCTVNFVATAPEARGRGLAGELMREALRRAREAGATTASLEGSAMGEPVYQRLGYRTLGRLRLLEHRLTPA